MTAIVIPNVFLPSTTISSTAMNANFTAVAAAIDGSLALDGTEIMTGAVRGFNGSATTPSFSFGSDLNIGMYRKATDELGFATSGALAMWLDSAGKGWFAGALDVATTLDVGGAATVDGAVTLGAGLTMSNTAGRTAFADTLAQVGAGFGTIAGIAAASTTDLGAAGSHHVNVTGGGTINSFGSSASASTPIYLVRFAATTTIVHSASIALPYGTNLVLGDNDYLVMRYASGGSWQACGVFRNTTGAPTFQRLTSGSATYFPTAGGLKYIRVKMVGGGGGGGAQLTNNGSNGGSTTFGDWGANGGGGGAVGGGAGGAGGTGGANGTGTLIARFVGGVGQAGPADTSTGNQCPGGAGGSTVFGGGGGSQANTAGSVGKANTGAGGGGGGATDGAAGGSGGGAGEYVEFIMTAAQVGAGVSFTVGANGVGGAAGGNAGGNGAAGLILVEENYV